jgi:hypothetical protein
MLAVEVALTKQLQSAEGIYGWRWNKSSCHLPLPLLSLKITSGRQISLRCFAELVFQFRRARYD